jgi:hypothetical protein
MTPGWRLTAQLLPRTNIVESTLQPSSTATFDPRADFRHEALFRLGSFELLDKNETALALDI